MNILLLMMGGSGTRFDSSIPKQYIKVNHIPIFAYVLAKYNEMTLIDKIIIVSNKDYIEYVHKWVDILSIDKVIDITTGGENRSQSVLNGLKSAKKIALDDANVLIHDATHPYVDEKGCQEVIDKIEKYGAATLVSNNYDTVYQIENGEIKKVLERKNVVSGASPEGFKLNKIYEIYSSQTDEELAKMTSAGAVALNNGLKMIVVETDLLNLKLTYKKDLEIFKNLINNYYFKD